MEKTEYKYVVRDKGYRGGMARIKGTGVTVAGIVIMHQGGDSLEAIVAAYPGLTLRYIQDALDYYAAHKAEIDRDIYASTHPPKGYQVGPKGILRKK